MRKEKWLRYLFGLNVNESGVTCHSKPNSEPFPLVPLSSKKTGEGIACIIAQLGYFIHGFSLSACAFADENNEQDIKNANNPRKIPRVVL